MKSNAKKDKENIYSLKGFDKVFKFTLAQTFKNRAYIVSLIMFVILMALMGPIQYFSSRTGQNGAEAMSKKKIDEPVAANMTVIDATALSLNVDDLKLNDLGYENVNTTVISAAQIDFDFSEKLNTLAKDEIVTVISIEQTGYNVSVIQGNESDVPVEELDVVSDYISERVEEIKIEKSSVSEEEVNLLKNGVYTNSVMSEADYRETVSNELSRGKLMGLSMIYCILIMIVSTMSSSYIISSVTEEKTSKLVESLLVSVRPMALLLGKICGMLIYIITILVLGFGSSKVSSFIIKNCFGVDMSSGLSSTDFGALLRFGVGGTLLIFISILIAYIAFGGFSGMMGSACTKTEDVQSATGTVMGLVMFGYMGAVMAAAMDLPIVNTLATLIPPFSFYTSTVYYLAGRINLPMFLLSFAIQIVVVIAILLLCAKTYRRLILSGNTKPKLINVLRALKN